MHDVREQAQVGWMDFERFRDGQIQVFHIHKTQKYAGRGGWYSGFSPLASSEITGDLPRFEAVAIGSRAYLAGIRIGDLLMALDGDDVEVFKPGWPDRLKSGAVDRNIELIIRRNG